MGDKNLLLEIMLYPAMTQPSGMRVYADGLYRYMEGSDNWSDVWTFTDDEMTVLKLGIEEADIPSLKSKYEAPMLVSDGTTTVWSITFDEKEYQINLAPGAQVPELNKLYHTFSTLRKLSPEQSNWHVWQSDGTYKNFSVMGSVNAVDPLVPLVVAMFVPPPHGVVGTLTMPPETILVKTEWITENQIELTKLYASGRYTREVEGNIQEDMRLPIEQVLHVIHAIETINWSKIPELIKT